MYLFNKKEVKVPPSLQSPTLPPSIRYLNISKVILDSYYKWDYQKVLTFFFRNERTSLQIIVPVHQSLIMGIKSLSPIFLHLWDPPFQLSLNKVPFESLIFKHLLHLGELVYLLLSKVGLGTGCLLNIVFFPSNFVIFLNSASSAAALVFYLPCVCTHTDTEGKQSPEYF